MKKVLAILISALMILSLAACGESSATNASSGGATAEKSTKTESAAPAAASTEKSEAAAPAASSDESYLIGISLRTLTSPYFEKILGEMKEFARPGTEFIVTSEDDDVSKQVTSIDDMIQAGCDVILMCPCNSTSIKPALVACQKANIPVVVYDSPADDIDLVNCTVVSDNYASGYQAGKELAEKLGGKGKVAEYVDVSQLLGIQRTEGWRDAIAEYPDIEIVNTQEGPGDSPSSVPKMEAILEANPDIVGMFSFNDPSAAGCVSVIEAQGKTDQIQVVSIDGISLAFDNILKGWQYGTSMTQTRVIAEKAMEAAYTLIEGGTPEKEIIVDPLWITSENINEVYNPDGTAPAATESASADTTPMGNEKHTPEKDHYTFGISLRTLTSPYFEKILGEMKEFITDGTELIVTSEDDDVSKQVTSIDDMIQAGCDVILMCPCNSTSIKPALVACQKAGIPVVVYDSPADDIDLVNTTVVGDNYAAGYQAGKMLAEALGGKGQVAEYVDVSQLLGIQRTEGWRDAIAEYPDIEIVNTQEGPGDSPSSVPKMEAILEANPDIVGMFSFNDPSAAGCVSVIEAQGKTDQIQVVSIDGISLAFDNILKGWQLGTSMTQTKIIAEEAINAAYALADGAEAVHEIIVDPLWITIDNIDDVYTP